MSPEATSLNARLLEKSTLARHGRKSTFACGGSRAPSSQLFAQPSYGLLTQPQSIGDQREADEADEQCVELVEAREDAPEAFEAPEQPLDLVAALVHLAVVLPGLYSGPGRRHDRDEAQIEGELDRLVARVGTVHQQVQRAADRK